MNKKMHDRWYNADNDESHDTWLFGDKNEDPKESWGEPLWKIAKQLRGDVLDIKDKSLSNEAKTASAYRFKVTLVKCVLDPNLDDLTIIFRDKKADNILGYETGAISKFVNKLSRKYPQPNEPGLEHIDIGAMTADDVGAPKSKIAKNAPFKEPKRKNKKVKNECNTKYWGWVIPYLEEEKYVAEVTSEKMTYDDFKKYVENGLGESEIKSIWRRCIFNGFNSKKEADDFKNGMWIPNQLSDEVVEKLNEFESSSENYKEEDYARICKRIEDKMKKEKYENIYKQFNDSINSYPQYCVFTDGSYDSNKNVYSYGFATLFDGEVKVFNGAGKDDCGSQSFAGELFGVLEAIKHASKFQKELKGEDFKDFKLTIIYDNNAIGYAAYGYNEKNKNSLLVKVANAYIREKKQEMKIDFRCINGKSHENGEDFLHIMADELATKANEDFSE